MKAVVMAGGEGSRLRPLTINRPKPMVSIIRDERENLVPRHLAERLGLTSACGEVTSRTSCRSSRS